LARPEILHVERVLAGAGDVDRVGQAVAVVADRVRAEREERVPEGEDVQVERHLLGRVYMSGPPAEDGVLLALLGPRIVEVAAPPVGDGLVVLLDAAEHLPVERLLERRGGLEARVGVGVLGLEVGDDLGVVLLAEPEVVVLAPVAVDDVDLRDFPGDGRPEPARRQLGSLHRPRDRSTRTPRRPAPPRSAVPRGPWPPRVPCRVPGIVRLRRGSKGYAGSPGRWWNHGRAASSCAASRKRVASSP